MLRAIHAFPEFSNAAEIEATRSVFDPLARKIRAHVTLVFPFESGQHADEVTTMVREVVGGWFRFPVSLGRAEAADDGVVWLPIVEGREELVKLHDALYRTSLGVHEAKRHRYEPHVTVARGESTSLVPALSHAIQLRGPFRAMLDQLTVEVISQDESSHVESVVHLGKKEPNKALEPTRTAVTSPAVAGDAPAARVAHPGR